jgi:hypothetical protein
LRHYEVVADVDIDVIHAAELCEQLGYICPWLLIDQRHSRTVAQELRRDRLSDVSGSASDCYAESFWDRQNTASSKSGVV